VDGGIGRHVTLAVSGALGQALAELTLVVRRISELLLAHHDPPQEAMGRMFAGERDPPEHLHRAVGHLPRAT
jgi:hypothetical protein